METNDEIIKEISTIRELMSELAMRLNILELEIKIKAAEEIRNEQLRNFFMQN